MKNLLVVDDEIATRLAVCHQIRGLGAIYQVRNLEEVKSTLAKLKSEGLILHHAIVDLRLAGSPDGFAIIEEIGRQSADTTITILTVRNDRDALERAKKLSAVKHLITKPWKSDELQNAVKACLAGNAAGTKFIGEMEGGVV